MIEIKRVVHSDMVDDIVRGGLVDVVAHWCNCFQLPDTNIYRKLDLLTDGGVRFADIMESTKGDINKLGTYTDLVYSCGDVVVHIHNLYVSYALPCPGMNTVHSISVFDGLQRIIGQMESGQHLAIPDLEDSAELNAILETLASDYESELPDITIMVIE